MLFDPGLKQSKPAAHQSSLLLNGMEVPLLIIRNLRARRYLLRLCRDGSFRLIIPRRGSIREGLQFAQSKTEWAARVLQKQANATKAPGWIIGTEILLRGELVVLKAAGEANRDAVSFGSEVAAIPDRTVDLRRIVECHLRDIACRELPARVIELSSGLELKITRVTVRNQRTRWGSCSAKGVISLNWRLIQAPAFVCDYIILHELMHLRQMNHSSRFWREVRAVCPDYMRAEKWLKQHAGILRE